MYPSSGLLSCVRYKLRAINSERYVLEENCSSLHRYTPNKGTSIHFKGQYFSAYSTFYSDRSTNFSGDIQELGVLDYDQGTINTAECSSKGGVTFQRLYRVFPSGKSGTQ
jgi:hypothetical protein